MIVHPAAVHVDIATENPVEIELLREALGRAVSAFREAHPDADVSYPVVARRPAYQTVVGS